jgi:hypothetical protein
MLHCVGLGGGRSVRGRRPAVNGLRVEGLFTTGHGCAQALEGYSKSRLGGDIRFLSVLSTALNSTEECKM